MKANNFDAQIPYNNGRDQEIFKILIEIGNKKAELFRSIRQIEREIDQLTATYNSLIVQTSLYKRHSKSKME